MNTKTAWIAVVVILILAFAWYAFSANEATAPTETATSTSPSAEQGMEEPTENETLVTLTDDGFSPARVTVSAGETVRFVNQSSRPMWVGSDEHPTHTEYDGTTTREHCADGTNVNGTFDQCAGAPTGSSWEYTFLKSGTFGYHNHLGAAHTGTVVVQ